MTLIRWQPWYELDTVRRQLDQLFDDFAPVGRDSLTKLKNTVTAWAPSVELKGNETEFVLRAELPGVDQKDLDIQVGREAVSISGEYRSEAKTEEKGFFRSEFRYGNFHRVIPLPAAVQNDQVKAEFKAGILTLTLPRVEARPQVVKVTLGEAQPATAMPEVTNGYAAPDAIATPDTTTDDATTESTTEDVWTA